MAMDKMYNVVSIRTTWFDGGGHPQRNDPTRIFGVKRLNILFQLEY
jgi:hypothetical protein